MKDTIAHLRRLGRRFLHSSGWGQAGLRGETGLLPSLTLLWIGVLVLAGLPAQGQEMVTFPVGSTDWVVPAGVKYTNVTIRAWGGGGSGSAGNTGGNPKVGSGGGGGAYASIVLDSVVGPATYQVFVGAGGPEPNPINTGTPGQASFVRRLSVGDTLVKAAGGAGGVNETAGGAGGSIANSIGQVRFAGGAGSPPPAVGVNGTSGGGGAGAGPLGPGLGYTNSAQRAGYSGSTSGGGSGGTGAVSSTDPGSAGTSPGGGGGGCKAFPYAGGAGLVQISYSVQAPLPVVLASFEGQWSGRFADLQWRTESEVDSDYFRVEHSSDGRTFAEVGKVAAAGLSYTARSYAFEHRPSGAGVHYYRLYMVDTDGSGAYSKIIAVAIPGDALPLQVTATGGMVRVEGLPPGRSGLLRVMDLLGRPLISARPEPGSGEALLSPGPLAPGMYLLQWLPDGQPPVALLFHMP